jgi:hypothetical protein
MLYARVNAIKGEPSGIEEGISRFRDEALPFVQHAPAFMGGLLLIDRSGGRAMGLLVWDSEANRDATDAGMQRVRDEASQAMGAPAPEVRLYEVPVYDLRHRAASRQKANGDDRSNSHLAWTRSD